jgi:dienelactone hydrolase
MLVSNAASAAIGSGSRYYDRTFDGVKIRVYTYRPSCSKPGIMFIFHGTGRDADGYRDSARRVADQRCLVLFAPYFDSARFPSDDYQRGGIVDSRDRLQSSSRWTTRFVELMIPWAKAEVGGRPKVYLYGHSAGAQFLSRVAAYERIAGIERYVVANPSTYVLPSLSENIPYGFDLLSTNSNESKYLREYLALPITIYLGELDNDPNDPDLANGSAARRQGAHRLERGLNTFAMAQKVASENGWTFNWRLTIAPGVGHTHGGMIRSSAAAAAFGF